MPEIFFRLDAGPKYGLGHFARCYNLAKTFNTKNNLKCYFICAKKSKNFFLNKNYNFIKFIFIPSKGFNSAEINILKKKIKNKKKPILIIDSKEKIKSYLNEIKDLFFLVCFDDEDF